ncbi:MAG: sugar transferase [Candidatus Shapirobacteria bacterium]|nr:sugar transferase [Candidatus Shapirobacteria bacterium]
MFYNLTKRTIDIVVSLGTLIIFSPVFLIAPLLIKLGSPGPVFADTPKRVGKNGVLFRMYKFRSMVSNAHDLLLNDPKFRKLYEEYKKGSYKLKDDPRVLKDDPRVTKIGKILRRFSLDELPQIFNVLRGEMSLVGPRAYFPDELENQQKVYPGTKKYVNEFLGAKPGITGNWQVSGRSEVNFDKRVRMDADYVRGRSIKRDILIILKTPWAMLSGKGAL